MFDAGNECIQVEVLTKSFGRVKAVDGVSFSVSHGEVFGFLGPNGAGKTTTINMLTGLARPDSGRIVIDGVDCSSRPKAAQHLMGVVPDESNLYPELTGFENLCFCGALYSMKSAPRKARAGELLGLFGLSEAADRRFAEYSKGMKRRLVIAAALMHSPGILFLDEPTAGIDVESARGIRGMLEELQRNGTTIFLTTHHIEEAERLCDRVAFIVEGRLRRLDSLENLLRPVRGHEVMVLDLGMSATPGQDELERRFPGYRFSYSSPSLLTVTSPRPIPVAPLAGYLSSLGIEVFEARRKQLSLDDVFVRVTGIGAHLMKSGKPGRGHA
ncbi:MAG TPA: ABC transporter ATP-binding protein [Prosthecochloris aestuarii]|uniref:ABC transporter ATP-binding protein n=1 Tax=Prosthecochloris aestuarii TaxID=1102 RepID=A0A831SPL5_PROAE|nr:ABC transporter ATP-binding protein [Prosthecochloris aestuarii]